MKPVAFFCSLVRTSNKFLDPGFVPPKALIQIVDSAKPLVEGPRPVLPSPLISGTQKGKAASPRLQCL